MQTIPPSTEMREALSHDLHAGFQGHPLRQFVRRAGRSATGTATGLAR